MDGKLLCNVNVNSKKYVSVYRTAIVSFKLGHRKNIAIPLHRL